MATGCETFDEFCRNVDAFVKLSDQLKDGWKKETFEDASCKLTHYMVKRNVFRQPTKTSSSDIKPSTTVGSPGETLAEDDDVEETDIESGCSQQTLDPGLDDIQQYEYHILYSDSYNVPVLYFTACKSDGKLLSLDEVWQAIPAYYQARLQHQRWTFITQQEHPVLGRPFFQLHPCHTADLMQAVLPKGREPTNEGNYLVTWLSSVGPVIGLSLPLAYSKLCSSEAR